MEKYVLIILDFNWSDEFDVSSIEVMKKSESDKLMKALKTKFKRGKFYFGTNEGVEIESLEKVLEGIKIKSITESFYKEFKRKAKDYSSMVDLAQIVECLTEEE